MKRLAVLALLLAGATALALTRGPSPDAGTASSHREAPLISNDPAADNTDLYAFRAPDSPQFLTVISNWIPAEDPAAGPMWYAFSASARYFIYIDRNGDAVPDVTYRFKFEPGKPVAFLRNTSQKYTVTRIVNGKSEVVAKGSTPPNNVGPRFLNHVNYRDIAAAHVYPLEHGGSVFAGQRDDGFFGDIGAVFDLVGIRKGIGNEGGGKDFFAGYGVHAIAVQIPIAQLDDKDHTVGLWSTTQRKVTRVRGGHVVHEWQQVSRLANPLVNEVVIPTELKDQWNRGEPKDDAQYGSFVTSPTLAALFNQLYSLGVKEHNRTDLVQVFGTGVPGLNFTGNTVADMLRINLSIPPTPVGQENRLGVLGGDLAGYPNGRRLGDDVIDIAEQAVAGALIGKNIPLGDGVNGNDTPNLTFFPYEADPFSGFDNSKGQPQP